MPKKDWSKEIKKMTATKGVDPYKMEITPFRDWKILVAYTFAGLIISLGYNVYMSFQINHESFFSVEKAAEGGAVFNSKALSEVLENIATKEANFEKIKKEGVPVSDPSIASSQAKASIVIPAEPQAGKATSTTAN